MKDSSVQGGITVVYIEADHSNALLTQVLTGLKSNYTLHHASDGLSGLELCGRVRPDLVITEIHLPDLSAYEVLQALRADTATESLPCIVLSDHAMPGHIEQAMAAGFDAHWTKPVDVWHLLQKIDDFASEMPMESRRKSHLIR
ncbi:response regulator [Azohydromonas australica]|uniref:response regulator n=1 Tax=Azohydromonas australica TaxID=364039 RepID=UPI00041DE5B8|nr:response regulator [Azohydromonas australica]